MENTRTSRILHITFKHLDEVVAENRERLEKLAPVSPMSCREKQIGNGGRIGRQRLNEG